MAYCVVTVNNASDFALLLPADAAAADVGAAVAMAALLCVA